MSVEAMTWALRDAPDVPSQAAMTLMGLANHADHEGRGSHPAQKTLTFYARKGERQVRRDLALLEEAGLIRKGDQRLVSHYPADRRPVVWDLAMERRIAGPTPEVQDPTAGRTRPVVEDRPDGDDRADAQGKTPGRNGRTSTTGGAHTSDKPSKKKTSSSSPAPRKRAARAEQNDDEPDPETAAREKLAAEIVQWWWDLQAPKPAGGSRAFFAYRTAVMKLLAVGWEAKAIANAARTVGSPITVPRMEMELNRAQRLAAIPAQTNGSPQLPRPEWCRLCDERTRMVLDEQEQPERCPRCHPATQKANA